MEQLIMEVLVGAVALVLEALALRLLRRLLPGLI
jgi:hypothetical protein